MRRTHHTTDTETGDQHRHLLDRLVGDASAVDDYYTARQQAGADRDDLSAGTAPARTWP